MIRTGSLLLLLFIVTTTFAQEINAYAVFFKDKGASTILDARLSKKALERRIKYNISIEENDIPVNRAYVNQITSDLIRLRYTLRWHNAAVVESSLDNIDSLLSLDFVKDIKYVGKTAPRSKVESPQFYKSLLKLKDSEIATESLDANDYGAAALQNMQIGATIMHKMGYDGTGITIAVFDAGFKNLNEIPAFLRMQGNSNLTSGYDVVDLDNTVFNSDNHGTAVTSCIGSFEKGKYIGTAPNASLVLFRTEKAATEYPLEELNWCKAAELADSFGVDLITSSLGYTEYDDKSLSYVHGNLTGEYSFASLAARTAFEKGIVVVNSAGNAGDNTWRKIGTPADVKEVLTVGAVDMNDKIGSFSSQGYNAKGDIKPDVCGMGVLASVASPSGGYYQGFGTSYSTPVVSGGVACLMQAHPDKSPEEITQALRYSAAQSNQPDSLYGYGIANIPAAYEYLELPDDAKPQFLNQNSRIVLYNGDATTINYDLFLHKRFLLIFKLKKKESSGTINNATPITHFPINPLDLKCSEKYTLRVKLSGGVENHALNKRLLYACPN